MTLLRSTGDGDNVFKDEKDDNQNEDDDKNSGNDDDSDKDVDQNNDDDKNIIKGTISWRFWLRLKLFGNNSEIL